MSLSRLMAVGYGLVLTAARKVVDRITARSTVDDKVAQCMSIESCTKLSLDLFAQTNRLIISVVLGGKATENLSDAAATPTTLKP